MKKLLTMAVALGLFAGVAGGIAAPAGAETVWDNAAISAKARTLGAGPTAFGAEVRAAAAGAGAEYRAAGAAAGAPFLAAGAALVADTTGH